MSLGTSAFALLAHHAPALEALTRGKLGARKPLRLALCVLLLLVFISTCLPHMIITPIVESWHRGIIPSDSFYLTYLCPYFGSPLLFSCFVKSPKF